MKGLPVEPESFPPHPPEENKGLPCQARQSRLHPRQHGPLHDSLQDIFGYSPSHRTDKNPPDIPSAASTSPAERKMAQWRRQQPPCSRPPRRPFGGSLLCKLVQLLPYENQKKEQMMLGKSPQWHRPTPMSRSPSREPHALNAQQKARHHQLLQPCDAQGRAPYGLDGYATDEAKWLAYRKAAKEEYRGQRRDQRRRRAGNGRRMTSGAKN